jgi:regulator of protease activity HflC (stomatin/prohibitin superfamily)
VAVFIALGVIAFFALFVFLPLSVKIVREYQRLVVFRLGRAIGPRGPGLVFLIPFIDRPVWVDLREFFLEIPRQDSITKDNAPISIDFISYFKVFEPVASVVQVQNFTGAAENIAATTLRAVVGDIPLDDVLSKRDEINHILRAKLDEITERWGVKVTNVEIREIIPPPSVQEAMTRQMSAERTRRAVVLEADGTKTAAVTVAEGDKQANILKAEGEKQSAILRAEGARQSAMLNAEGFAQALKTVFEAASQVDAKTMGIQYLEALKALGASPSTKFVVPLEFTSLLRGIGGMAGEAFSGDGGNGGSVPAAAAKPPRRSNPAPKPSVGPPSGPAT